MTDDLSENTTCGEVPAGDLFDIIPTAAYSGDILASVHLTNVGALMKAYQHLNMQVYLESSVEAGESPSCQTLTIENGQATFNLVGISDGSYTLSVTGELHADLTPYREVGGGVHNYSRTLLSGAVEVK